MDTGTELGRERSNIDIFIKKAVFPSRDDSAFGIFTAAMKALQSINEIFTYIFVLRRYCLKFFSILFSSKRRRKWKICNQVGRRLGTILDGSISQEEFQLVPPTNEASISRGMEVFK